MSFKALKDAFLDLTQDAVAVGFIELGADTARIVYVNDAFVSKLGYRRERMMGRAVDTIHDQETWDTFIAQVEPNFRAGRSSFSAQGRLVRADGSKYWANVSFIVVPDEETGGRHVCATYHDISKLKAAQATANDALYKKSLAFSKSQRLVKTLEAEQARLFAAMNSYPEPIAIYDRNEQIFLWNDAFALTVSDCPKAIRQGMTVQEIVQIGLDTRKLKSPIANETIWIIPPPKDDGTLSVVDVEVRPDLHRRVLRNRTPQGDHVIMCLNTSAVVLEQQAAETARVRMIDALNAYPEPIVIYDKDLFLVSWNDAYTASITSEPGLLKEGLHLREVLEITAETGRYVESVGRKEEWIEQILSNNSLQRPLEDLEMAGDVHYRLSRSRSSNGDYVAIRMNTTEFVRQKRTAEAAQERLIAALNAYPSPFAIYDAEERLIVWNHAYRDSMTNNPDGLSAGMLAADVARAAVKEGKIASARGREDEWMSDAYQSKRTDVPVEDVEMEGDIHHRLLRSRAENGDLVLLRIDMTELVRQRRTLEATQERLISAINAFPDPFAIYDSEHNLVIWNPAYARSMTDNPEEIAAGTALKDLLMIAATSGKIAAAVGREQAWVDEYYTPDRLDPGVEDFEFENDQHYRMVRSRAVNGEYVVLRINITEVVRQRRAVERYAAELEKANQAITHKALHDELTGLGNRRYLSDKFDEFVSLRQREGGEIAALHVDLDRFKQINDTMGHPAGDKVLTDAAKRICQRAEDKDVVARIGGDEFVVLLHIDAASDRPERLASTIIEDLSRPTLCEGKECRFGASIGLARTPLAKVDELLINSDVALYKAKNAGRGQLGVFDQTDLEEVRIGKALADDVLRAIDRKEFVPYYQPQVDANTGEIVGMEAVARWQHPTKGVLAPDAFLAMATDLSVAADIDRMIFETAIVECEAYFGQLKTQPSLSFNVSAKRVDETEVETIKKYVQSYSGQVAFELLETIFLEEEDTAFLFQLDRLRDLGIDIEVDDFGSGRASVVALQRIGPDRVKIDRRLVAPVTASASGLRLTRSIVEIGIALGIGVTAEGVETREQADILADLGCDRLQGYYFARPMAFPELLQFFESYDSTLRRA